MRETFFSFLRLRNLNIVDTSECQDVSGEENCMQKSITEHLHWIWGFGSFLVKSLQHQRSLSPQIDCSHRSSVNQHQTPLGNHMNQMQTSITLNMSLKQDDLANLFQTSTKSTSWTLSPKYFWQEKICLFDWNHTSFFKTTSMIITKIFLDSIFKIFPVASLGRNPNYCHR